MLSECGTGPGTEEQLSKWLRRTEMNSHMRGLDPILSQDLSSSNLHEVMTQHLTSASAGGRHHSSTEEREAE